MSLTRDCICPMVLSHGSDQLPVSTIFDLGSDEGVVRNYGRLLLEMVSVVPDGIVCFFVSYSYMDSIVNRWNELDILKEIMQHRLVFIETQDVVETTLALDNYRKACDCGRGAVFFSVASVTFCYYISKDPIRAGETVVFNVILLLLGSDCWRVWINDVIDSCVPLYMTEIRGFDLKNAFVKAFSIAWLIKYIKICK